MTEIEKIIKEIEEAVNGMAAVGEQKQKELSKQLPQLLKSLQTRGDELVANIENFKRIFDIKASMEKTIIDGVFKQAVKNFVNTYKGIEALQNDYFAKFNATFTPKETFKEVTRAAMESSVIGLTEVGVEVGVTDGIKKMLADNIGKGGSYAELTDSLRNYITPGDGAEGALAQYIRTYATTAINQFSAEYNKTVSDDLGLEWYGYDGSLLTTSRPFCIKMVAKEYIHKSEFETVLSGDFGELGKVKLTPATGLPAGLMEGTDEENLIRRRGGWNCGHQMHAVAEVIVPQETRDLVYASAAYKAWKAAEKKKAKKAEAEKAGPGPEQKPKVKRTPKPKIPPKPKPLTLDEAHDYYKNITLAPEEDKAVKIYTGSSYDPVNRYLRGIDDTEYLTNKPKYDKTIKELDDYLPQAKKVDATTYRGIRLRGSFRSSFLARLKVGEQLIDDGFMSTSYDLSVAESFSTDCIITVKGKSGVLVEHQSSIPTEREILFSRGHVFTITYVEIPAGPGGTVKVTLEEVD